MLEHVCMVPINSIILSAANGPNDIQCTLCMVSAE